MISKLVKEHTKVYDNLTEEYEKNIPKYFEPTKQGVEILSPYLKPKAKILDIGCGVGLATQLLIKKGFDLSCIDLSSKMIEKAKKRNLKAKCIIGDFLKYSFEDKYDAIISLAFIHLFPKDIAEKALKKMHKLLKPNGYLYIGTTESKESKEGWELKQDILFPNSLEKRYRKHWTQEELKKSLIDAGFKIEGIYLIDDPRQKIWMDFLVKKI